MMKRLFFLLTLSTFVLAAGFAQDTEKDKKSKIKSLIGSKNYVFNAQSALPMGARTIQLTSEYNVQVIGDSLSVYLPYYGRAYTAPVYPSEGGIRFNSTHFNYQRQEDKHGGWDIDIKLQAPNDVQQLHFIISEKGYATLQVISLNRQPISFNGYITERKSSKK